MDKQENKKDSAKLVQVGETESGIVVPKSVTIVVPQIQIKMQGNI